MIIEGVGVTVCRIAPSVQWEDATNKVECIELLVVDLTTSDGRMGTGFSYSVDIGGSAMKALVEDYFAPLLIGENCLNYEHIWNKLHRQSRRLGLGLNAMAQAAVDIAIWDLIGKIHNQPLHRLLGGARPEVKSYISEINLSATDTTDELKRRIEDYVSQGYDTVKIKIGREDFEEDLERLNVATEAMGSGGTLLVDLNQKWTLAEAKSRMSRLDQFNLGWVEEPLLYTDVAGHAELRSIARTPVAIGESLYGKSQFLDYLSSQAVDVVQADVAFVGGITEWLKIAHLSHAFGKLMAPHFMKEISIHLLCGVQNSYLLENVVGGSFEELGLLKQSLNSTEVVCTPTEKPGHGIVLNRSAVAKHELHTDMLQASFSGGSK